MNMKCANKDCTAELKYLRGGRLFFMERQSNLTSLVGYDTPRIEKPVTMRRYFWLCEYCSQVYTIRRWTENGIELIARSKPVHVATPVLPRDWNLPGLVG